MALDIEKYRSRLIEERDRLNRNMETVSEISQPASDKLEITAANAPSNAEAKDIQTTVAGMKADRFEQILAALQSIDDGTYGMCIECGKPIDPRRLDADPAAMTCMDCLPAQEANFQTPKM